MRSLLIAIALLAATLPLSGASAASLGEDPQGDVQTEVFGLAALPAATAQAESADLLSLDVAEDAESLTFTIGVVNLKHTVNFLTYQLDFTWAKSEYHINFHRQVAEGVVDDSTGAYLYYENEEGWNDYVDLDHTMDVEGGLVTVVVPKAYLLSANGRYPLLGDKLTDMAVTARAHTTVFQFTASAYDRMPDADADLSYALLFGDIQTGHLRLDADERVRVSNGGSTTFVYKVTVANRGEAADQVRIDLSEMPEGWNATVQSPIRVPASSERSLAILVSVPFAHDHGGFSSFNVTARSEGNANSAASVRLGVLHTPIPQPAGHHSELCLHATSGNGVFGAVFPYSPATMNTECDHTADVAESSPNGYGNGYVWYIPLDPGLRMGLDFDLERMGEAAGSIIGHTQAAGKLTAELFLSRAIDPESGDAESLLLAESDSLDMTLDLSTPQPFKLTLTPLEEADYIPYARGQNMILLLRFETADDMPNICCFGANTPGLQTSDFKMTLPLNEYHDKLTGLSESAESLEITAVGPVEKAGFPGATLTYAFTLTNHDTEAMAVDLDTAGTDALLGTLVPDRSVHLGPKESAKITLAVRIPVDKNDGEELEVLLFAHGQEDPSKTAIARTKTLVAKTGSGDAFADETDVLLAAQAEAERDSPLGGTMVALAALAAVALALRRRRA